MAGAATTCGSSRPGSTTADRKPRGVWTGLRCWNVRSRTSLLSWPNYDGPDERRRWRPTRGWSAKRRQRSSRWVAMTIVPRNGKFGVKVWDPGQKHYRWVGSFDTQAEAAQAERDATLKPGKDVPTVEQWGRIWLSDYARPAPATRQVYRQAVKVIAAE